MIQRTRKSLGKIKKRRVKLRTLLLLSLTLIFNTYAWFLYATTVSTNITVHVNAWKVNFEVDGEAVAREFEFEIENAYPGMETIPRTVDIQNLGDSAIDITLEITSVRIFEDVYTITEEPDPEDEYSVTSEQMMDMLENGFPFQVTVSCVDDFIDIDGESGVEVDFSWPYETIDSETNAIMDDIDTEYGVNAYNYYEEHEGEAAISIVVKVCATQHNSGST